MSNEDTKRADALVMFGLTGDLAGAVQALDGRAPVLAEARDAAAAIVGEEEAWRMVLDRPHAVVSNAEPDSVPLPVGLVGGIRRRKRVKKSWPARLFNR